MSLEIQVAPRRESFLLLERLGRGGLAEAWRALRRSSVYRDEVCLKRPLVALGAEARRALLEEARVLGRVRHGNVVSLLDVIEDERGRLAIVMELVRGFDLRRLGSQRAEPLRASTVASIGLSVCRALAAAQRAVPGGLVHRDVTPHNVLISRDGEIKLADFGIARALDRATWTAVGTVKGKLSYLSPEQLQGQRLDVRSDLFALGVVLFELLAQARPFSADSDPALMDAILAGRRRRLDAQHAPAGLRAVVDWLLAPRARERPSSADAAAEALSRYAMEHVAQRELAARVQRLGAPTEAPPRLARRPPPPASPRRHGRRSISMDGPMISAK